jgi:uncharacterized caspase-like protein
LAGGAAPAASARAEGQRTALVIGNADYVHVPKLGTPKADADLVAAALRSAGFAVAVRTDLTRAQMLEALQTYTRDAQNADWALFYFSGFGVQVAGQNYIIPVDAHITQATDLESQAVPLDSAVAAGTGAKALNVVVLDAGRENPFPREAPPPPAAANAPSAGSAGTIVLYATSPGGVVFDGTGPTSPFSTAFAKNMRVPGLELKMLFNFVRDEVLAATNQRQQPFIYGALPVADLFFIAK